MIPQEGMTESGGVWCWGVRAGVGDGKAGEVGMGMGR